MKKRMIVGIALAVLFAAAAYPQTTRYFFYVANYGSNTIAAYTLNMGTGALAANGPAIRAGMNPEGIVVDPTNKFLYVVNNTFLCDSKA